MTAIAAASEHLVLRELTPPVSENDPASPKSTASDKQASNSHGVGTETGVTASSDGSNGLKMEPIKEEETSSDDESVVIKVEKDDAVDLASIPSAPHSSRNNKDKQAKTVVFHSACDMRIEVNEPGVGHVFYEVSSSLVSSAIPALGQEIFALDFDNSGKKNTPVLTLVGNEDRAFGLDVLLCIAHYMFKKVPKSVDLAQLFDLALVVGKYDCAQLVVPWVQKWVDQQPWDAIITSTSGTHERALVAAWIFGLASQFCRVLYTAASNTSIGEDGTLVNGEGKAWKDTLVPGRIIDMLGEARAAILSQALSILKEPVEHIMSGEDDKPHYCQCLDSSMNVPCESMMLGSAIVGLTRAGMWPFPEISSYRGSPCQFVKVLDGIQISRFKEPKAPPHLDHHTECGLGHRKALNDLVDFGKTIAFMSDEAVNCLKVHGAQCGILAETFLDAAGTILNPLAREFKVDAEKDQQVITPSNETSPSSSNTDSAAEIKEEPNGT